MFLNKLITLFVAKKLPPPFSVIFFLTVHDPEEDVKTSVSITNGFSSADDLCYRDRLPHVFVRC